MKIKINEPIPDKELWVTDAHTGLTFKTTLFRLEKIQKEIEEKLNGPKGIWIEDLVDMYMTEWTEEQKKTYLSRPNKGWIGGGCSGMRQKVNLLGLFTDNGEPIVMIDWD